MTDIASDRAMSLQNKIVESIIRAHDIDSLSDGGIKHIFKDLFDDASIADMVYRERRLIIKKRRIK